MVKAKDIARFLGKQLIGPDIEIYAAKPLLNPQPNCIVFAKESSVKYLEQINLLTNVLVLADNAFKGKLLAPHILSSNPRLDFAKTLNRFFSIEKKVGIAPSASISPKVRLGKNIYIGNFSVIDDDVQIGDETIIRDHVVIRNNTIIGSNCLIKSNTVIGEEGFGFEYDENNIPVRIPHLGGVRIGDNVEIGALNVIVKGTLEDTIIESNVKIDDHVFIAHNCNIGENTLIIAGAEISGSVCIGKNVWIAPQAAIINQVAIGDSALIGIGAIVTRSVDPNTIVAGNPAKALRKR